VSDRPNHTLDRARHLLGNRPPEADDAERALLSCCLNNAQALAVAQDIITTADVFGVNANAALWDALTAIADKGGEPHLTAVEAVLAGRGLLSNVGGVNYLIDVYETERHPSPQAAKTLAEAVVAMHTKRQLVAFGQRVIVEGYESKDDIATLLDKVQAEAMAVGAALDGHTGGTGCSMVGDIGSGDTSLIGEPFATGYVELDRQLKIRPGSLTVVGARPSMGKSAMMTGMAIGMAKNGTPCCIHSMEMSRGELRLRMEAGLSRVNSERITEGKLPPHSMEGLNLRDARDTLGKLPIAIDDRPGVTIPQLRQRVRTMVSSIGARVFFVDYLQLMVGEKSPNRQEEVSGLSRHCKLIAREFDVALVVLSQLNRQLEAREDKRPRSSDLRESGSIEQDADNIALLYREDEYKKKDPSWIYTNTAEVIIAKQRNGPTGVVRLHFDAETAAMHNAASSEQEAAQEEIVYG
jgi:replicative DNA helicase